MFLTTPQSKHCYFFYYQRRINIFLLWASKIISKKKSLKETGNTKSFMKFVFLKGFLNESACIWSAYLSKWPNKWLCHYNCVKWCFYPTSCNVHRYYVKEFVLVFLLTHFHLSVYCCVFRVNVFFFLITFSHTKLFKFSSFDSSF